MATPTRPPRTVQSRIVTRLRARSCRRSAAIIVAADLRDAADLAADIAPGPPGRYRRRGPYEIVSLLGPGADAPPRMPPKPGTSAAAPTAPSPPSAAAATSSARVGVGVSGPHRRIECREHRIDYYAELALGHDPWRRAALKTKTPCDTNGDAQLAALSRSRSPAVSKDEGEERDVVPPRRPPRPRKPSNRAAPRRPATTVALHPVAPRSTPRRPLRTTVPALRRRGRARRGLPPRRVPVVDEVTRRQTLRADADEGACEHHRHRPARLRCLP